ncbi:MAG: thioredoxin [Gammaproteobacteria bacterium]|nr:thioredoxin [Gammaproteobacteria bacterium]
MSDSPHIHNVTLEDFESVVIQSSFKQPVLVDFWAEWCQPCKSLIPVLHKLAEEYQGAFILAKVNTDEQGDLAAQAGVKSLPTVKLFVEGKIVNEFMGALPESEVRKFLDPYIQSTSQNESEQILNDAIQAFSEGNEKEAMEMLNAALANDPQNVNLKINMAKLVANQNDFDSALALIDTLSDSEKEQQEVKQILSQIKLAKQLKDAPDPEELEQRIKDNPDDLDAFLQMSNYLIAGENYEAAITILMQIMQKDRTFNDDAGRKGLIAIFDMLGSDNPLVQKYRRKMFALLH